MPLDVQNSYFIKCKIKIKTSCNFNLITVKLQMCILLSEFKRSILRFFGNIKLSEVLIRMIKIKILSFKYVAIVSYDKIIYYGEFDYAF